MGNSNTDQIDSIIVDGIVPGPLDEGRALQYQDAGIDVINWSVFQQTLSHWENGFRRAIKEIKEAQARIESWEHTRIVRSSSDLESDELSVIFGFQDTSPIEKDPENVRVFEQLGVKLLQLTYNSRNLAGTGCTERYDEGVSNFGLDLIDAIEAHEVVLDLSHASEQTTLDAMDAVGQPSMISHTNAQAVYEHPRNCTDEEIKAAAETGGVVGATAYPPTVSDEPTLSDMVDHIDHMCSLVGPEHVSFGLDLSTEPEVTSSEKSPPVLLNDPHYPDPPYSYPEGIQVPSDVSALAAELDERGYSDEEISGIMGENFVRVCKEVWQN